MPPRTLRRPDFLTEYQEFTSEHAGFISLAHVEIIPIHPKKLHAPVSMDLRKDRFRKENDNLQQEEFELTS